MTPQPVLAPSPLAPPLPRIAQIEPIGRCNLACRMCTVNERGDAVADMPLERFKSLAHALGMRLHLPRLPQEDDAFHGHGWPQRREGAGRCDWPWQQKKMGCRRGGTAGRPRLSDRPCGRRAPLSRCAALARSTMVLFDRV